MSDEKEFFSGIGCMFFFIVLMFISAIVQSWPMWYVSAVGIFVGVSMIIHAVWRVGRDT